MNNINQCHGPFRFGPDDIEGSPIRWAFHVWSWAVLFALFLALELWVDPLAASLVLCCKLGWRDVLAAIRLRRHPAQALGQAMSMYCLALGCFKVALAGMIVASAVIVGESLFGVPAQLERFLAGFVLLTCGLIFGETMIWFAADRSCRHGIRGWLDGTLYENLLERKRALTCRGTHNRLSWLLPLGTLLLSLTWLPAPIAAVAMLMKGNPGGLFAGIVFTAFWMITVRPTRAAMRNLARSPAECWGAEFEP